MSLSKLMLIVAGLAIVGCTRPNPSYDPNPALPDECRRGVETSDTFSDFARPDKLDLVFVVDASGDDPAGLQELFANAAGPLGALMRALNVDARAVVVTTDATESGFAGPAKLGPTCADNDTLIADLGDEDWGPTLRCNLFAAPSATAYDQPLLVVKNLLDSPPDDFFREDARLMVVIGTRSDDCSASGALLGDPLQACADADLYGVDELVAAWGEHRSLEDMSLVVFAGSPSIVGAEQSRPVCQSTVGSARAGNRLYDAVSFMPHGSFHSVCTDDVFLPLGNDIEQFVTASPLVLCPGELTHEPLAVSADGDPIPLGEEGFLYVGATATCPGGALEFAPLAVSETDQIEITYCTPEE